MGLRLRVVLMLLAGFAVAVGAASWVVARLERARETTRAIDSTTALLHALGAPVGQALSAGHLPQLDPLVAGLGERGLGLGLRSLAVLDARGAVVAHTQGSQFGQQPDDAFVRRARASDRAVVELKHGLPTRVAAPVAAGLRWGTFVAELEPGALEARVVLRQRELVWSTLAVSSVGALLLLLVLSLNVLAPLEDVVRAARALQGGDLGARAAERGAHEVQTLARTLNAAAERQQAQTAGLEAAVRERTSALEVANARLEELAVRDPLTGLFNRRRFQEALDQELHRLHRTGRGFALLLADVDHFKHYNDTQGHPAGDAALQALAALFQRHVRALDLVARFGGEEFVFLLPEAGREEARAVAERVRAAVAAAPIAGSAAQPGGCFSVSLGVACAVDAPTGQAPDAAALRAAAEALVARADAALYAAKRAGRNAVVEAPP